MSRVTLVTGGGRSGKSRHALALALATPAPRVFVATAEAFDDEMKQRIQRHREERAADFITVEAPLDPAAALTDLATNTQVIVIDCLTVWLGNLLYHHSGDTATHEQIDRFLTLLEAPPHEMIIVTNEVGMGIVPDNALARRFRDLAGTLNQQVAARADKVIFMVSGYPLIVKEQKHDRPR